MNQSPRIPKDPIGGQFRIFGEIFESKGKSPCENFVETFIFCWDAVGLIAGVVASMKLQDTGLITDVNNKGNTFLPETKTLAIINRRLLTPVNDDLSLV